MTEIPPRLTTVLADRYTIERELGQGGMATVYLAEDLKHHRQVAVKVLKPELAAAIGTDRFLREIEIAAGLSHPHILPLHDSGEADGVLYYVMPFVDGESLADRCRREGQLPIPDALRITREVADALAYAHGRGVIHRDIKPENILLHAGHAVVADFGIARAVGAAGGEKLTGTGMAIGTPAYMSPEQSLGETVDARSDIYALGAVLYEMLAGEPPYTGPTAQAITAKRLIDPIPDVRVLRETVPAHVHHALTSALAKSPADRFSTAALFAGALAQADGGAPPEPAKRPTHNLPESVDSFVGREEEIAEITAALTDVKLLTITGVGGTGKTRLATTLGERLLPDFEGGVWLVELATVLDDSSVPSVIADTLGITPQPDKSVVDTIAQVLSLRHLLLILDNCEHVLDAVAEVASAVTSHCPQVRILATSREGLAVRGERIVSLTSLSVDQGVTLFRDRARDVRPAGELHDTTLARLSQRLDGIPLAIELAAARCRTMSPEEVESRLGDRFRLLRGSHRGRMERHQTLRNAVAWSYDLLDPTEQGVFDRLSVFSGGFTLEAAVAVTGGDGIDPLDADDAVAALVGCSMVSAVPTTDGTWYRLLETLRQFGEERLVASGNAEAVKNRHLAWYVAFAQRAHQALVSSDDEPWYRAVRQELDNLHTALYRGIDLQDLAALESLGIVIGVHVIVCQRLECNNWLIDASAAHPSDPGLKWCVGFLCAVVGRTEDAVAHLAGLPPLPEEIESDSDFELAVLRFLLAFFAGAPQLADDASRTAAAAARPWTAHGRGLQLKCNLPIPLLKAGEVELAKRVAVEALAQAQAWGNTYTLALAHFATCLTLLDGDPGVAFAHAAEAERLAHRLGATFVVRHASSEMAALAVRMGDEATARVRVSRVCRQWIDSGDLVSLWMSAHHMALLLHLLGRVDEARTVWNETAARNKLEARHHQETLTALLGKPGESRMSDREFITHLKDLAGEFDDSPPR